MLMLRETERVNVAGGDDCQFHVYDLRIGTQHPVSSSKLHEAGVTSLHSNALYENVLASGRYREALKVNIPQCFITGYLWYLLIIFYKILYSCRDGLLVRSITD
jgi:hypothetical protein